jgi:hypothetical protein
MSFFVKQKLLDYKKYKVDIWGLIRNSLVIQDKWKIYSYSKLIRKYNMYMEAKKYNLKRKKEKKYSIILNHRYLYKIKLLRHLIKKIFYLKPSKKMNKICFFFFNKKKRRMNFEWWKRKYFIYEVRDLYIKRKRYNYKKEFSDLRLAKYFYIMYTYRQFKKMAKKAKKKDGIFEQNYMIIMECKLPAFIYRTSFLPNMFESIHYIKKGIIAVNKIFRSLIFFPIKTMDLITFRIWEKGFIYWEFYKRLRKKAFLFFFPKYMYISIIFFFILCLNTPKIKDIINPISMDIYKASSFIN